MPQYRAFFREDGVTVPPEAIRRNLGLMLRDRRAGIFFLAEVEGQIAGLASGSLTCGVEFGWACELEDLYVRSAYRGRGLARRLAESVLAWAAAKGAQEVCLVITPEAEAGQGLTAFYRKLGFADSRRITMYRSAHRDPGRGPAQDRTQA